jgi:hypothetical protein
MIPDERTELDVQQFEPLVSAFREQLLACLEECARGRRGLFASVAPHEAAESNGEWPEAARLRELAIALQGILAQAEQREALVDEFLDLCTIHGESDPGERRLARVFLERIERGQVGMATEEERKPW